MAWRNHQISNCLLNFKWLFLYSKITNEHILVWKPLCFIIIDVSFLGQLFFRKKGFIFHLPSCHLLDRLKMQKCSIPFEKILRKLCQEKSCLKCDLDEERDFYSKKKILSAHLSKILRIIGHLTHGHTWFQMNIIIEIVSFYGKFLHAFVTWVSQHF